LELLGVDVIIDPFESDDFYMIILWQIFSEIHQSLLVLIYATEA
jgi:hypothetical protein